MVVPRPNVSVAILPSPKWQHGTVFARQKSQWKSFRREKGYFEPFSCMVTSLCKCF
jgi:hypothetical protein